MKLLRPQHLLLALAALLLTACVPQRTVRANLAGEDRSVAIPVKDLRPANEKKNETFSLLITSSAYGILRKGDETLSPTMSEIFRRRVFEKMAPAGGKMDITVHHMVVYMNGKSATRSFALGGMIGGAVGGALVGAPALTRTANTSQTLVDRAWFEGLANDEHRRSFFKEEENPEKAMVYVIYIDADVNGKRTFVRTLSPTLTAGKDAYLPAVESTIQYWIAQNQAAKQPAAPKLASAVR